MPISQVRQSSFAAGEVSPSFFGRTDFGKFDIALRKCRNWIVGPQGSLFNRSGTQYVATTKTDGNKVRLIPFQFSDGQSFVLEFGNQYIRFYREGAQAQMPAASAWNSGTTYAQYDAVSFSGRYYVSRVGGNLNHSPVIGVTSTYWIHVGILGGPLEIVSPYVTADLPNLKFAQSGDVITFASQNHPPYTLSRYPSDGWLMEMAKYGQTAKYRTSRYLTELNLLTTTGNGYTGFVNQNKGAPGPGIGTLENMKLWGYAVSFVTDQFECLPAFSVEVFMLPAAPTTNYTSTTIARGAPVTVYIAPNGVTMGLDGMKFTQVKIYKGRGGSLGTYGLVDVIPFKLVGGQIEWVDDGSLSPDFSTPPPKGGAFPGTNIEANAGVIPDWAGSTQYYKSDRVKNGTHVYEATCTGKSWGTGPTHTAGEEPDVDAALGPFIYGQEAIIFPLNSFAILNGKVYKAVASGTISQAPPSNFPHTTGLGLADGTVTWDFYSDDPGVVRWKYVGEVGQVYNDFPGVVLYANQRLIFANSLAQPAHIWGSEVGNYVNFLDLHLPSNASDPYDFELAYNTYEEIRGFVSTPKALLTLTSAVEWVLGTASGDPISPVNIDARPNSQRGCEWLTPMLVGNAGLFVQARSPRVRELMFNFDSASFGGLDLSMLSTHLFDGYTFTDWAQTKVPFPAIWMVRADGAIVACTYAREQEFVAWHWHDTGMGTNDAFEQICVISEEDPVKAGAYTDAIYVVVKRGTKRYIERFFPRFIPRKSDGTWDTVNGIFSDSAVAYRTAIDDQVGTLVVQGTTVFTGLDHLEGREVTVLIDGYTYGTYTVGSGQIDVVADCPDGVQYKAIIGLPYYSDIEFLPPKIPGADIMRSNVKLLPRISFEVADSRGETFFGPNYNKLLPWRQRDVKDSYGLPQAFTGLGHVRLTGVGYDHDVTLCVRQVDPLPVNLLAIEREIDVGGD